MTGSIDPVAGTAARATTPTVTTVTPAAPVRPSHLRRALTGFTRFRRTRPFWGSLVLLGGAWFIASPLLGESLEFYTTVGVRSITPLLLAGGMAAAALVAVVVPAQRHFPAIVAMMLAVASLPLANLGGWLIGMVLGIAGSGLVFAWAPYTEKQAGALRRARRPAHRPSYGEAGGPMTSRRLGLVARAKREAAHRAAAMAAQAQTRRGTRRRALVPLAGGFAALVAMFQARQQQRAGGELHDVQPGVPGSTPTTCRARRPPASWRPTTPRPVRTTGWPSSGSAPRRLAGLCAIAHESVPVVGEVTLMILAGVPVRSKLQHRQQHHHRRRRQPADLRRQRPAHRRQPHHREQPVHQLPLAQRLRQPHQRHEPGPERQHRGRHRRHHLARRADEAGRRRLRADRRPDQRRRPGRRHLRHQPAGGDHPAEPEDQGRARSQDPGRLPDPGGRLMAARVKAAWAWFGAFRRTRPFWGGLWCVAAGAWIIRSMFFSFVLAVSGGWSLLGRLHPRRWAGAPRPGLVVRAALPRAAGDPGRAARAGGLRRGQPGRLPRRLRARHPRRLDGLGVGREGATAGARWAPTRGRDGVVTLSVRRQRWLVLLTVLALGAAALLLPRVGDEALGQPLSSAAQPFACDQPGSSDPQQRRQDIQTRQRQRRLQRGRADVPLPGRRALAPAVGQRRHLRRQRRDRADPHGVRSQVPEHRLLRRRRLPHRPLPGGVQRAAVLHRQGRSGLHLPDGRHDRHPGCTATARTLPRPRPRRTTGSPSTPTRPSPSAVRACGPRCSRRGTGSFTVPVAQPPTATHLACGLVGGTARGGFLGIGGTCEPERLGLRRRPRAVARRRQGLHPARHQPRPLLPGHPPRERQRPLHPGPGRRLRQPAQLHPGCPARRSRWSDGAGTTRHPLAPDGRPARRGARNPRRARHAHLEPGARLRRDPGDPGRQRHLLLLADHRRRRCLRDGAGTPGRRHLEERAARGLRQRQPRRALRVEDGDHRGRHQVHPQGSPPATAVRGWRRGPPTRRSTSPRCAARASASRAARRLGQATTDLTTAPGAAPYLANPFGVPSTYDGGFFGPGPTGPQAYSGTGNGGHVNGQGFTGIDATRGSLTQVYGQALAGPGHRQHHAAEPADPGVPVQGRHRLQCQRHPEQHARRDR
ncbi:DUF6114 domain-containing protein [Nocardioides convexus]|uniref:DUF6114 domain-containing protein n=1 Tax=Nocardioides convexus TaxID=2712224 RepID=UPI0024185A8F|nr:DUF6114 domain-containing protein [Nocardioides convexus]